VGVFRPHLRLLDYNRAHVAPSTFSAIGSLVFYSLPEKGCQVPFSVKAGIITAGPWETSTRC